MISQKKNSLNLGCVYPKHFFAVSFGLVAVGGGGLGQKRQTRARDGPTKYLPLYSSRPRPRNLESATVALALCSSRPLMHSLLSSPLFLLIYFNGDVSGLCSAVFRSMKSECVTENFSLMFAVYSSIFFRLSFDLLRFRLVRMYL